MQCDVYSRAVSRISQLQTELRRLEEFVSTYRELSLLDEPAVAAHSPRLTAAAVREETEVEDRLRATPQAELERVVEEVIIENGAPLQRSELLQRVKARGVIIGGSNETANFGSKLSRASRLTNVSKYGYWPKDRPFAEGGYLLGDPEPKGLT